MPLMPSAGKCTSSCGNKTMLLSPSWAKQRHLFLLCFQKSPAADPYRFPLSLSLGSCPCLGWQSWLALGSWAWSLCVPCRFPRLHSAVIRTFVLVQHYAAAMMAVSGLPQMKNHTSVETLEITQNLLNSPKQCPCGHGLMVLLRVPCSPLAAVAYERLAHVRARLSLEEHFEIILGHPSSGITVGKHFVKQLKVGVCSGAEGLPGRHQRMARGGGGSRPFRPDYSTCFAAFPLACDPQYCLQHQSSNIKHASVSS